MNLRPTLLVAALLVAGCAAATAPTPGAPSAAPTAASLPPTPASMSQPTADATAEVTFDARAATILGPDFTGAAAVTRGNAVLLAEGYGKADVGAGSPNETGTQFRIGSITKQFTAFAILLLEADGAVAEDDRVCTFIDDCPPAWKAVTIRELIGHTSGIPDYTERTDVDWSVPTTPAKTLALVSDQPLLFAPGASFNYSNTEYTLLGMVIERASGMSYADFLRTRIFEPLRMAHTGFVDGPTPGHAVGYTDGGRSAGIVDSSVAWAAGGLSSTVDDLVRWGRALDAGTLASKALMERFFTPLADTTDRLGFAYAYGVYVGAPRGTPVQWHDGGIDGFTSVLYRVPDARIAVVALRNRDDGPDLVELAGVIAKAAGEAP